MLSATHASISAQANLVEVVQETRGINLEVVENSAPRVMPTGFTLEAAARAIASSPASLIAPLGGAKKVTDLIIEEGPRPPKSRRRQQSAECVVCIYPYSRDAATVWENCKQPGLMLWQVQLDHNARNSLTIGFYESFTKFLQQEDGVPDTI